MKTLNIYIYKLLRFSFDSPSYIRGSNPGGGEIFSTRSDRPGAHAVGTSAKAWRWPPTLN